MRTNSFLVLVSFVLLTSFNSLKAQQCTLVGETINRTSKALLIRKHSENSKVLRENPTRIQIRNRKFTYTFTYTETEAYELVFEDELQKGNWVPITFFPRNGIVELKLYPQTDWRQNKITGGDLNAEHQAFQVEQRALFDKPMNDLIKVQDDLSARNELDSDEYKEVLRQLRATPSGDHDAKVPIYQKMDEMRKTNAQYTEKAKQLFVYPYDSLRNAEFRWKYDHIKNNVSLVSLYLIFFDVELEMKNNPLLVQLVSESLPLFENKYPDHIYTRMIKAQVKGFHTIAPGNKYIDFKAPTLAGETVQLSDVIKGKIALIDLWGSWCGPCIAKSRLVVPIYDKYKSKGFEVVGIAREFKTTDAVKRRLAREQFNWINLVELDDKQKIWNTYGISNGTGLMVLIDRDGTILAVDPKPEELEKIVQEKL